MREEEKQFPFNIKNEVRFVLASFFCEFVHALELSCSPFCGSLLQKLKNLGNF